MTNNNHPITPPPELVKKWHDEIRTNGIYEEDVATKAARWGADMELKACCEWASQLTHYKDCDYGNELRTARRPKPKSLAEEALEELQLMEGAMYSADLGCDFSATRRALERLQELEGQGDD